MTTPKSSAPALIIAAIGVIAGTFFLVGSFATTKVSAVNSENMGMMMSDSSGMGYAMAKGQIANVQLDNDSKPAWIESGIWVLRVFPSSDPQPPAVFFVGLMHMLKPDGTAVHSHSIFNYEVSKMSHEGNTTVFNGTATVTMRDGPVTEVPLTIKIMNNAAIAMWIGPDKVDGHFGSSPIFGTLVTSSAAMMGGNMNGGANQSNNVIKMSAKEVDGVYRWSTSDGINPTLKMAANANNVVQIDNPTDAKHELVIEQDGKELASSGDIGPDSSGQLTFKPTMTGTFEYHCEYHPDTMKGTVQVTASS